VQQGRLDDAAPYFRKAAQIQPNYRDYLLQLGTLYEKANRPAEAMEIFREFPDNPAVQARLGEMLMESKKYADALPQRGVGYRKWRPREGRRARGGACVQPQDGPKALPLLDKAVPEPPNDFALPMMYARRLGDRKQFPAAAQQFYAAAKLKPTEP